MAREGGAIFPLDGPQPSSAPLVLALAAMLPGRLAFTLLLSIAACAPQHPAASPPPTPELARCAVWNRELSFARSVADHDAAAFADHVMAETAFTGGAETLRTRDAVVKGWVAVLAGKGVRFEWRPAEVVITGDPRVAMSRGPVWIESTRADGTKRLRLGAYMSTWVLDRDGAWRVAVDGGQDPVEATEDEVAKSKAETPVGCLAGR